MQTWTGKDRETTVLRTARLPNSRCREKKVIKAPITDRANNNNNNNKDDSGQEAINNNVLFPGPGN